MRDSDAPQVATTGIAAQRLRVDEAARRVWREPPIEVLRLYFGVGRAGAGPIPQTFTTWSYVREDTRWICQHALPFLIRIIGDQSLSRQQISFLAQQLLDGESEFLAWLGLGELGDFLGDFLDRILGDDSSASLAELGHAIEGYTHRLQNWTTHYFPWGLGALFPQRAVATQGSLLERALQRNDGDEGSDG